MPIHHLQGDPDLKDIKRGTFSSLPRQGRAIKVKEKPDHLLATLNRALVTSASPLMVNLGWISDLIG